MNHNIASRALCIDYMDLFNIDCVSDDNIYDDNCDPDLFDVECNYDDNAYESILASSDTI